MAFPSDSAPFVHLGPAGDTRGIARLLPGETIRTGDLATIVANAHRQYTCAQRACAAIPSYQTQSLTYVEAARVLLSRVAGRDGYVVYVDHELCNVRCSLRRVSDGVSVDSDTTVIVATREAPSQLVLDASSEATSTALYLLVEVVATAPATTGTLHGGVVVEDAAST